MYRVHIVLHREFGECLGNRGRHCLAMSLHQTDLLTSGAG